MKFNPNEDFNKNIGKLLSLLQKMMKEQKIDNKELNNFFGKKNVNLNLCFFTFMPFSFEDLADMEEFMEEGLDEVTAREGMQFELNKEDLDFLKQNGIKF